MRCSGVYQDYRIDSAIFADTLHHINTTTSIPKTKAAAKTWSFYQTTTTLNTTPHCCTVPPPSKVQEDNLNKSTENTKQSLSLFAAPSHHRGKQHPTPPHDHHRHRHTRTKHTLLYHTIPDLFAVHEFFAQLFIIELGVPPSPRPRQRLGHHGRPFRQEQPLRRASQESRACIGLDRGGFVSNANLARPGEVGGPVSAKPHTGRGFVAWGGSASVYSVVEYVACLNCFDHSISHTLQLCGDILRPQLRASRSACATRVQRLGPPIVRVSKFVTTSFTEHKHYPTFAGAHGGGERSVNKPLALSPKSRETNATKTTQNTWRQKRNP